MSKPSKLGNYEHLPRAIHPQEGYTGNGSFHTGTRITEFSIPNKLRPLNLWNPPAPKEEGK